MFPNTPGVPISVPVAANRCLPPLPPLRSSSRDLQSPSKTRKLKIPKWTDTDERQDEHVKESVLEQGKLEETAKEVAARTVNKHAG